MKKIFIHISDLHIAEKNRPGIKQTNDRTEKTWLIAQKDSDNGDFIREFCNSVMDSFGNNDTDYYLLISGDIADSSSKTEYEYAKEFLEQIVNTLNVKKTKVLIVPGNHDIFRPQCQFVAVSKPDTPAYQHFEAKYCNFKAFYDSFYEGEKIFGENKQIVDYLAIKDEKLLFVGINTNYKIDYLGGTGAVEIDAFTEELTDLCNEYKEYSKIAVFHHNIRSDSKEDNTLYGSWDENDWINFKRALEKENFKILMFGNEHTRASSWNLNVSPDENAMYLSDSGSFALHAGGCKPSYKVYELYQDENKTALKQCVFILDDEDHNYVRRYGRWCEQKNKPHCELEEFILRERKPSPFEQKTKEDISKETGRSIRGIDDISKEMGGEKTISMPIVNLEPLDEKDFQKEMMTIIKSEHLYHPGHFHWGKSSRSHNWIDTVSLLDDRGHIHLIQGQIRKQIKEIEECEKVTFDAYIGIGMEGNIMSTQLLLENIPYVYLPYTDRYEEFNDFERNVCLDNSDGGYKNVLIITDVVNRGRMLKRLIEEKSVAFFSKVDQVYVVSLFYTGNYDDKEMPIGLKDIKDKTIKFYSLMQLEVGKCPYDDDFENTCIIYKEHLCEVYEFYSE